MLKKYRDLLDKAKEAKFETIMAWYTVFNMREDPFLAPIPPQETDYFVDREEIVESIIFDVGVASRGIYATILLVGPRGSGRTAILQYVFAVLRRLAEEDKYSFSGEFHSSDFIFSVPEPEEEEKIEVHRWVEIANKEMDYIFVDDARPEHVKTIMQKFVKARLKVFAISPLDFEEVVSALPIEPTVLYIRPLSYDNTLMMMSRRLGRVLMQNHDEEREASVFDLFLEEAIQTIYECAMGVPFLALKCASKSLHILRDLYREAKTTEKVGKDVAARACKLTKCHYSYTEFDKITKAKEEVLRAILGRGRTPTELSSFLRKDRTTISRHLSELRELGLVEYTSRGRKSVYEATEPVKIRFEIEQMPKEVWKYA